jgi:type IV secretion system protein VirB6
MVFEPAYEAISGQLSAFLTDRVAAVAAVIQPPLLVAMTLYFVLYGIAIWRGAVSEPLIDIGIRGIKLAMIYAIATGAAAYGSNVTEPLFTSFPQTLAQAVSGGAAPAQPGQPFDQFMGYAWDLGNQDFQKGGTFPALNLILLFAGAAVFLIGTIAAALGFAVFIMALVALAMIITLGPIFIALCLFDVTRRYFFGWLNQALNYLLLYALIITVFQMVLHLVTQTWVETPDDPAIASLELVALSILGAVFALHLPNLSTGIVGGASAGLSDFVRTGLAAMPRPGGGGGSRSPRPPAAGGRIFPR